MKESERLRKENDLLQKQVEEQLRKINQTIGEIKTNLKQVFMSEPNKLELDKEEILNLLDEFINSHRFLIDIEKLYEIERKIKELS